MFRKRIAPIVLALVLVATMTGCIKLRVAAHVQPNGALQTQLAMGMTQQARTVIGASGQGDPFEDITPELFQDVPGVEDVKVEDWTEGDYQFRGVSAMLPTLSNLQLDLSGQEMFRSVAYRHTPGTDVDRFDFRATIDPEAIWREVELETDSANFPVKVRSVMAMELLVSLPGNIIETNGRQSADRPNTVTWELAEGDRMELFVVAEAPHNPDAVPVEMLGESDS